MTPILIAIFSIILACASGLLPIIFLKRWFWLCRMAHFSLLGLAGCGFFTAGFYAVLNKLTATITFSNGLPFVKYSLYLDVLSGFFLCLIGIVTTAVAFYGPSYIRHYESSKQSTGSLIFFTGFFVASLSLVVIANDVFSFMFSWELMSLTSYFLVLYQHQYAENRRAALVYLLMAHLSGFFILTAFGILVEFSGGLSFHTLHLAHLSPVWASIAFLFAFLGFGMKSGIVPLHVWLPQAHPVAPSHISALMSGVMLKIAVYGLMRFIFSLLGNLHWQWGMLILFVGCLSALLGILYALMQNDLKSLLAYSSVENVGIIFIGLGLAIIFLSNGYPMLGALGIIASLYHCINHALFKSLLFLGAGSVLQHTHEHNLEKMGGLIHKMPQTAFFFLIGCVSIIALPPFNGFVSEWLTFQTALQAVVLKSGIMRAVIPVSAAVLALTGALAAACFAKVYGVAFLGKSRTRHVRHARVTGFGMRFAMAMLAGFCLLFGILPTLILPLINTIPVALFGVGLSDVNLQNWLWLTPISTNLSSYSPLTVFAGLVLLCLIVYLLIRRVSYATSYKIMSAWDCGFGGLSSRMQYTATAFSMPIRRVFKGVCKTVEKISPEEDGGYNIMPSSAKMKYELHIIDLIWQFCYEPIDKIILKFAKRLAYMQGGNVRTYLAYTFFTLVLLLLVVA